ncbi:MAG: hypothetical protein V7750_17815 [Sneathiella sp.]
MVNTPAENIGEEADVFSRGSLNLTYELIRKKDAELALTVRNISHEDPINVNSDPDKNRNSDFFRVALDSFQVRAVVENLMLQDDSEPGRAILAKVLMEDWMKLATKMIADLPDDQKPPIH